MGKGVSSSTSRKAEADGSVMERGGLEGGKVKGRGE
jgi:hypothetical protein